MAEGERDDTGEWVLSAEARPATLAELELRVDTAISIARASEAAALEIGAAALDAAEQARRAAELAERASAARGPGLDSSANGDGEPRRSPTPMPEPGPEPALEPEAEFDSLRHFTERADRVAARLRAMAPVP